MSEIQLGTIEFPSEGVTVTKEKVEKLSDFEMELVCYYEQRYWELGELVSLERAAEDLRADISKIRQVWKKEIFQNTLVARGLQWDSRGKGVLNPQQVILVNMLLDVESNISLRQKLQVLKISTSQYHAWLRDPAFQNYLRLRTEQLFEISDAEVFKALIESATDGDVPAIKLFMEMRGHYNPRVQVDVNIESVVFKVAEIINRHVKDPEVIEAIASELDDIKPKALNRAPLSL